MFRSFSLLGIFLGFMCACSSSEKGVYFTNVPNKVLSAKAGEEVVLKFAVKGMTVRPAGEIIENTGHHHLIINQAFTPEGQMVPADANNIHFGKGQTETTLRIEAHMKTLSLQFADGVHRSYGKDWSYTIEVKQ